MGCLFEKNAEACPFHLVTEAVVHVAANGFVDASMPDKERHICAVPAVVNRCYGMGLKPQDCTAHVARRR